MNAGSRSARPPPPVVAADRAPWPRRRDGHAFPSARRAGRWPPRPLRGRRGRGQATVELALALPVVLAVLLLVVEVGFAVRAQLLVTHAAREAARAAAVGAPVPDPVGLDPARTTVVVASAATSEHVTVEVRHRFATDLPLIGSLVPDVDLRATVTMRRE